MSELLTYLQVSFHPHPGFQPGITDSSLEPQWSYSSDRCSCLLKQSYTGVEFAVILHTAFSTHHTSTLHPQFTATFVAFARCAPFVIPYRDYSPLLHLLYYAVRQPAPVL